MTNTSAGVVALGFVVLTAGCVADVQGPAADAADAPDLARLWEFEHDHADPAEHHLMWNTERVAFSSLTDDGVALGAAAEIDVAGDVAAVHVQGARSGFALVDVSDPRAPVYLSFTSAEAYRPWEARDIKLDDAGEFAYLALQISTPGAPASPTASGGFLVYDVTDRTAPVLVGQALEQGRGCHMINYWEHDGARTVYCASSQGLVSYSIEETAEGPRTPVKRGTYVPPDAETAMARAQDAPGSSPFGTVVGAAVIVQPHDMTAQADPLTGEPVLVAAFEEYGIYLLDISAPTDPVLVTAWRGEGAEHFDRLHTALAAKLDGKRVLVGATETFGDTRPAYWLIDATDPSAPTLLAEWTPPGGGTSHGLLLSTHNIQVVGERLYMATWHAGVLVFDVADPTRPTPVAAYQHAEVAALAEGTTVAPNYWDVVVDDGYVYASDTSAGFVVVAVAGDPLGDPTWRSFA